VLSNIKHVICTCRIRESDTFWLSCLSEYIFLKLADYSTHIARSQYYLERRMIWRNRGTTVAA
jgi:hypothetical protein